MIYKYQLLKSSWGIVIVLDIQDLINPAILKSDRKILDNIFLRLSNNIKINNAILYDWFSLAIQDLYNEIEVIISNDIICFEVDSVDYSHTDFQEEGLYYAMIGWLAQKYSITVSDSDAYYSKETNNYVFPNLKIPPSVGRAANCEFS